MVNPNNLQTATKNEGKQLAEDVKKNKQAEKREGCPIPLVSNCLKGLPLPENFENGVKLVCSNSQCPFRGQFVHIECFQALEDKLVKIMSNIGPARAWTDAQRRANLWDKKGLTLIQRKCRCPCGRGLLQLDKSDLGRKTVEETNAQPKCKNAKKKALPKLNMGRGYRPSNVGHMDKFYKKNENFNDMKITFISSQKNAEAQVFEHTTHKNATYQTAGSRNDSKQEKKLPGSNWSNARQNNNQKKFSDIVSRYSKEGGNFKKTQSYRKERAEENLFKAYNQINSSGDNNKFENCLKTDHTEEDGIKIASERSNEEINAVQEPNLTLFDDYEKNSETVSEQPFKEYKLFEEHPLCIGDWIKGGFLRGIF